jgi:hypothetical protein
LIELGRIAGRATVHGEQELRLAQLAKHHGPAARVRRGGSLRPPEMEQGGFKFALDVLGVCHCGDFGWRGSVKRNVVKFGNKFFDLSRYTRYSCMYASDFGYFQNCRV